MLRHLFLRLHSSLVLSLRFLNLKETLETIWETRGDSAASGELDGLVGLATTCLNGAFRVPDVDNYDCGCRRTQENALGAGVSYGRVIACGRG